MLKRHLVALLSLAVGLSLGGSVAQAQIGFDDLGTGGGDLIVDGYAGYSWSNFFMKGNACANASTAASGYCAGVVSPDAVAFNAGGNPASVSRGSRFSFGGAWFTSAWNTGLTVRVQGIRAAVSVFDQSFVVNADAPFQFNVNWLDLDEVQFSTAGGVNAGLGGSGTHFAMDDLLLNRTSTVVPEPASVALMAFGLIGLVAVRRRNAA